MSSIPDNNELTWVLQASLGTLLINMAQVPQTAPRQEYLKDNESSNLSCISKSVDRIVMPGLDCNLKVSYLDFFEILSYLNTLNITSSLISTHAP